LFLGSLGVALGLLALIIVAIIYFQRQKKRKVCLGALFLISQLNDLQVWYGQMAGHYRNGGLPPWSTATVGVGDGPVKAQMLSNTSPSQGSYPKAQYENPTPFGVYGNLPAAPYSNVTDVTSDYSATILPTPIAPSLSPQPQHSQYSGTTGSFGPYNSTPGVRHSIVYARSVAIPTQTGPASSPISGPATQTRPLASPTPGAPSPYGGALANPATYNSTPTRPENAETSGSAQGPAYYGGTDRGPEHVEASSSAQAPAYFGGPYSANEYPKDKDQGHAVPPTGNPTKQ
jgi:hypothetical protein